MPLLILVLPLLSGVICGLFSKLFSHKTASYISSIALVLSSILSLQTLYHVHAEHKILHHVISTWFSVDSFAVHWGMYIDHLTAIMFVVVTVVSSVVHIYSYGYMRDDPNLPRFMSYLSLFTFFMLALVCADNFVQLFFGWEGVGLCSYLLIGFWYNKNSATDAAVKAFVVNRVGDFAFIIGILAIIYFTGSTDFNVVFALAKTLSSNMINILGVQTSVLEFICLMLFIGCMGKSAQIGLHTWLPDAMEGPTPVSALIHAATMVTAGVFLVARAAPLFEHAHIVSNIILWLGAATCIFGASTAIAQNDIKKIIAYSTCSQLGYMFMACGAYAYNAAIFHLVTHAFFKAMLFLSAGIVIHAVHEQDIRKMGMLRSKMPTTYGLFWVGSLAIMGIFPFAGYYSKDLILENVFIHGANIPFIVGICAAMLTAIYSMKILVLVFHGQGNSENTKVHEGENIMVYPLMLLAMGSIFGGVYLIDYFVSLSPNDALHELDNYVKFAPLVAGLSGMFIGIVMYQWELDKKLASLFKIFYLLIKNKYFFDEIYDTIFVRSMRYISYCSKIFDTKAIDNIGPNFSSVSVRAAANILSKFQSGYIFSYVFYLLLGLMGVMSWWLIRYSIMSLPFFNAHVVEQRDFRSAPIKRLTVLNACSPSVHLKTETDISLGEHRL